MLNLNTQKLSAVYKTVEGRRLLDWLATYERKRSETTVRRAATCCSLTEAAVKEVFRALDHAGAGRYVKGARSARPRRPHPCRIVWACDPRTLRVEALDPDEAARKRARAAAGPADCSHSFRTLGLVVHFKPGFDLFPSPLLTPRDTSCTSSRCRTGTGRYGPPCAASRFPNRTVRRPRAARRARRPRPR